MTLGADTVQVERVVRRGSQIDGMLVVRTPSIRIMHYTIVLDSTRAIRRYSQRMTAGDGAPLRPDPGPASLEFRGDTVIRTAMSRDSVVEHRMFAPDGAFPFGTIPIGAPFGVLELALASARHTVQSSAKSLHRLSLLPMVTQVSRTALQYVSPDSVVVDYFGQGNFVVVFDAQGQLLRSDWRNTTYKVRVARSRLLDVEAITADWARLERVGSALGRLSPRDTLRSALGPAAVAIAYGRPSVRGRAIWGEVLPFGKVWRLGADMATELTTNETLTIGDRALPAGSYSLWLEPHADGGTLIVNRQTGIFGTQYNVRQDLLRVPLRVSSVAQPIERLTITIENGLLMIRWADRQLDVEIAAPARDAHQTTTPFGQGAHVDVSVPTCD